MADGSMNVALTDRSKVFRGRIPGPDGKPVYVRGNAIVAVPNPPPQDVLDALKGGMLKIVQGEPHANTAGPLRPQSALPPLRPHYRSQDEAEIPNGNVSTTRTGGTNEDAMNAGPTGMTSQVGRRDINDPQPEFTEQTGSPYHDPAAMQSGGAGGMTLADLTADDLEALLAQKREEEQAREQRIVEEMAKQRLAAEQAKATQEASAGDTGSSPDTGAASKGSKAKGAKSGGASENPNAQPANGEGNPA